MQRPDTAEERYLSTVQHLASVLRACGHGTAVLVALEALLERAEAEGIPALWRTQSGRELTSPAPGAALHHRTGLLR